MDLVVLAVGHFLFLNIEELWINSGVGKHYRNIAAHAITRCLNESVKDLIMCHAQTECDTVSSFRGESKKTAWSAWMAYPAATDIFLSLLSQPVEISSEMLHKIEHFLLFLCTLKPVL